MNSQLQRVAPVPTVPCESFAHSEIITLLETLHANREPELEDIYSKVSERD